MIKSAPDLLSVALGDLHRGLMEGDPTSHLGSYLEWYQKTMAPGWTVPKHIEYLCNIVTKVIRGDEPGWDRVIISMPPGHAKSDTVTRRLPIYWGLAYPADTTVLTGYNQRFAENQLSLPCRELAREMSLLSQTSSKSVGEWRLSNSARVMARGVGVAPTGVNPISLLVTDDPIKDRAQAESETEREKMWQWWQGSIMQRFWPRTKAFVIATRWHFDDLIGRLVARDAGWRYINLPALAEPDDPLGRAPGEALWPEEKPREFLLRIRDDIGDDEFEALYQGNPVPKTGGLFRVANLHITDEAPPWGLPKIRAWDLAGTEGGGDWTVGVLMSGPDHSNRLWVLDVVRGQWEPSERDRVIAMTAARDGRDTRIFVPEDPGPAGTSQVLAIQRLLPGYALEWARVSANKTLRATPLASHVNSGLVVLTAGAWNAPLIQEMRMFPRGKRDDQVDAMTDAYRMLMEQGAVEILDDLYSEFYRR